MAVALAIAFIVWLIVRLAGGELDHAPAAEREPRQQEREGDPGDEQRGYRTGAI